MEEPPAAVAEPLAPEPEPEKGEARESAPANTAPLETESTPPPVPERADRPAPVAEAPVVEPEPTPDPAPEPAAPPIVDVPRSPSALQPHWLLSLFTPGPGDTVDWRRGNYTVVLRGGRIESPAASGELKKQIHMIAEGSVVFASAEPGGSAADVAPDGFAHSVYRAGFAVSIPLPEVE